MSFATTYYLGGHKVVFLRSYPHSRIFLQILVGSFSPITCVLGGVGRAALWRLPADLCRLGVSRGLLGLSLLHVGPWWGAARVPPHVGGYWARHSQQEAS